MKKILRVCALLGLVLVIPIAFSVVLTDGVQPYCEIVNKSSSPCTEIVGPVWWQMFAVHLFILVPIFAVVIVAPIAVLSFVIWFVVSVIRFAFYRTKVEYARALGVQRQHVYRLLSGETAVRGPTLKLCKTLEATRRDVDEEGSGRTDRDVRTAHR